jgi:protein involved in sex pheromone biosynthesis
MKILTRMLIILLAAGALVACGGDENENQEENQTEENQTEENQQEELVDIIATAEAAGDFTTLLAGIEAAACRGVAAGRLDGAAAPLPRFMPRFLARFLPRFMARLVARIMARLSR